ncbi:hypothetical protein VU07_03410 [Desulfobulbus sp. F4]|nr:hypothetical protein [Desulfobulbus sp. F4]
MSSPDVLLISPEAFALLPVPFRLILSVSFYYTNSVSILKLAPKSYLRAPVRATPGSESNSKIFHLVFASASFKMPIPPLMLEYGMMMPLRAAEAHASPAAQPVPNSADALFVQIFSSDSNKLLFEHIVNKIKSKLPLSRSRPGNAGAVHVVRAADEEFGPQLGLLQNH